MVIHEDWMIWRYPHGLEMNLSNPDNLRYIAAKMSLFNT